MLMPTFFILETDLLGTVRYIRLPDNARFAYKISTKDAGNIQSLYYSLFTGMSEGPFCLLIEWDKEPHTPGEPDSLIDYAVSFTYNRHYLQNIVNVPFLIFNGPGNASFDYIS